ncbi:MAG: EamA family transporter, partial [Vulcanococcus sp.]
AAQLNLLKNLLALALLAPALLLPWQAQATVPLLLLAASGVLGIALGALLCGSGGALLARAALRAGEVLPVQSAALRLAAAALVLLPLLRGLPRQAPRPRPAQRRWPLGLAATLLGTAAGIVLQQTALQALPGALAVALLATAPVMALPLARLEGDPPGGLGVVAALLALAGVSCVVG